MEMFGYYMPQTAPNAGQQYNGFRDSVVDRVMKGVYDNLSLIPTGGFDRTTDPSAGLGLNGVQVKSFDWSNMLDGRLAYTDSINLNVASTYDSAKNVATIIAKVTYLQPFTTTQNLSIAILEDSLVDFQEFVAGVYTYHFDGVFRDLVTAIPFGDQIFPNLPAKEPGRVCQKVYTYSPKSAWKAKNCRVVAFVHSDGAAAGQHVYQTWQAPLAH